LIKSDLGTDMDVLNLTNLSSLISLMQNCCSLKAKLNRDGMLTIIGDVIAFQIAKAME